MAGLFLLTLLACFVLSHAQAIDFNTDFAPYCSQASPCTFANATLWVPEGLPNVTSAVVINSTQPVWFLVPPQSTSSLGRLSLIGTVVVIVEGSLVFNSLSNYDFVVCDNSTIQVKGTGVLQVSRAGFFDSSIFLVQDNARVTMGSVNVTGSRSLFQFQGGYVELNQVVENFIPILHVSGNAQVYRNTTGFGSLAMDTLLISDSADLSCFDIGVSLNGTLIGTSYKIGSRFYSQENAVVTIYGCPSMKNYYVLQSSLINVWADSCSFGDISVHNASRFTIFGHGNYSIGQFNNLISSQTGTIAMQQTQPGQITTLSLKRRPSTSFGPAFLEFHGNYIVNVGSTPWIDNGRVPLSGFSVDGQLDLYCLDMNIIDDFAMNVNTTISIPVGGGLYVENVALSFDNNFIWTGGEVHVQSEGTLIATTDIEVLEGCVLFLEKGGYLSPSVVVGGRLHVQKGASLHTVFPETIQGNLDLEGSFFNNLQDSYPPDWNSLTINGNFTLRKSGEIDYNQNLPELGKGCILVNGQANLSGGTLNVNFFKGKLPENRTFFDIPILNATNIVGDLDSVTVDKSAGTGVALLSYKIENNTLWLHIGPTPDPDNNDAWLYFIVSGAVIGVIVFTSLLAVVVKRRHAKREYKALDDDE